MAFSVVCFIARYNLHIYIPCILCHGRYTYGSIKEPETDTSGYPTIHQYWSKVPDTLVLEEGEEVATWYFITSLSINEEEAKEGYQQAVDSREQLRQEHADVSGLYTFCNNRHSAC